MADWAFDGLVLVRLGDGWADVAVHARIGTAPPVPRTTWVQYRQATTP